MSELVSGSLVFCMVCLKIVGSEMWKPGATSLSCAVCRFSAQMCCLFGTMLDAVENKLYILTLRD